MPSTPIAAGLLAWGITDRLDMKMLLNSGLWRQYIRYLCPNQDWRMSLRTGGVGTE